MSPGMDARIDITDVYARQRGNAGRRCSRFVRIESRRFDGSVDPSAGTRKIRRAVYAGAPDAMSTIVFPGTERSYEVTRVTVTVTTCSSGADGRRVHARAGLTVDDPRTRGPAHGRGGGPVLERAAHAERKLIVFGRSRLSAATVPFWKPLRTSAISIQLADPIPGLGSRPGRIRPGTTPDRRVRGASRRPRRRDARRRRRSLPRATWRSQARSGTRW